MKALESIQIRRMSFAGSGLPQGSRHLSWLKCWPRMLQGHPVLTPMASVKLPRDKMNILSENLQTYQLLAETSLCFPKPHSAELKWPKVQVELRSGSPGGQANN